MNRRTSPSGSNPLQVENQPRDRSVPDPKPEDLDLPPPTALICLTGSELTRGETRDRNGVFLARELTALGFLVEGIITLPDDPRLIDRAFREALPRADLLVASGGLGPTADDLTIASLARALGRGIARDPEALARMRALARARGRAESELPENFAKQAEVVEGARVLLNPAGLAPGSLVETERGIAAALPGVPRELRAMFRECLVPEIRRRFALEPPRVLSAKVLGQPESWVEARVQALGIDFATLEYTIGARPGEITLKLIARERRGDAELESARERLEREFGRDLVIVPEGIAAADGEPAGLRFSRLVHELLVSRALTVATAESSSGGLIAKELTDHAGSSAYFLGSVVAYHNRIKTGLLGVPEELLAEHGAVSEPVCRAMALAARRLFAADYGISVTGIAGPSGGSAEKPVGLVYIGLACPTATGAAERVLADRRVFAGDRNAVREQTAVRALDILRRDIESR